MKNIAIFFSAASLLALATPGVAQNARGTPVSPAWHQDHPWLFTAGPDYDGGYSARISVADLDLATATGERTARKRVSLGIAQVCHLSVGDPDVYVMSASMSELRCTSKTARETIPHVDRVLAEARSGQKTAFLQLGAQRPHTASN